MKDLVRPPGERIVDSIGFENQYCYDKSIKMIDIKCSVAQLQAFVAVAEEGSFSAAARLLDKGQPAISTSISNLEATLGLQLFDRSERLPVLTSGGQALLSEARKFLYQAKQVQLTAENWVSADKARRLSIVIDVICPVHKTVRLIEQLYSRYPDLSLTLHTEARGAVTARILDDSCELGVTGLIVPNSPEELITEPLGGVDFVAVIAPTHPMFEEEQMSVEVLRRHNQLVLSDPSGLSADHQVGVLGSKNWIVGDQSTKYQFLVKGYGWGLMPFHEVEQGLELGIIKTFKPVHWESNTARIPLYTIRRPERPLSDVALYALDVIDEVLGS